MRLLTLSLVLLATAVTPASASADEPSLQGNVIVARPEGHALLIWDCTPRLASLIKDRTPNADILKRLEADSVIAMERKRGAVSPTAETVSVRIVYSRTGDISPVYGTPTFAGIERLATVTAPAAAVTKSGPSWYSAMSTGKTPSAITIDVSGKLPPQ